MKTTKYFAIALAALAMSFSACKKDETTTETPKVSGASLLVGKDWRVTGITMTSPGGTIDIFAAMDACDKDDLQEFLSTGNIIEKQGASKCDPSDPDTAPGGFWALLNNDTKLRIIDGDTTTADVVELTANNLRLRLVDNDMGITYTTNITMVKN
ncbi:MAG: hypothetical protein MH472_05855 [Bacteroidia bacterium]|nr:hypothetical protein [Bacteroidia bacterium]